MAPNCLQTFSHSSHLLFFSSISKSYTRPRCILTAQNIPKRIFNQVTHTKAGMATDKQIIQPCNRGRLIVFEGLDRSGKSTQCSMLADKLRREGHSVELLKFPDRTTSIGHMINNYLSNKEDQSDEVIHLLFSANRWESMQKMTNLLLKGTTLIVDRYAYSGIAYSAAKGMDLKWCRHPDEGLIRPDKVIFMTLSAEIAAQRASFGEERYEKTEFQAKVSQVFNQLYESEYWENVSGDGTKEDVHIKVYNAVLPIIQSDCGRLRRLWAEGTIEES